MSLMAGVPSLADLLSTYFGFVSAVTGEKSSGTGGALRLPVVQLALFVSMMGFAVLMYFAASRPTRNPAKQANSQALKNNVPVVSSSGFLTLEPALKRQTAIGPTVSSTRANSSSTSTSCRASTLKA